MLATDLPRKRERNMKIRIAGFSSRTHFNILVVRKAIWTYATYGEWQSDLQNGQNEVYVNENQSYLDGVLPLVFDAEGLVRGLGIARSRIHVMQQWRAWDKKR